MVSKIEAEITAASPEWAVYALKVLDEIGNKDPNKVIDIQAKVYYYNEK